MHCPANLHLGGLFLALASSIHDQSSGYGPADYITSWRGGLAAHIWEGANMHRHCQDKVHQILPVLASSNISINPPTPNKHTRVEQQ